MQLTTNYNLNKPEYSDKADVIPVISNNMDSIDSVLEDKMDKAGGTFTGNTTVESTNPIRYWTITGGKSYYISSGGNVNSCYFDIGTIIDDNSYPVLRWDVNGEVIYIRAPHRFRESLALGARLWSGGVAVGSTINVPNSSKYTIFAATTYTSNSILLIRIGNVITGSTAAPVYADSSTRKIRTIKCLFNVNGDELTLSDSNFYELTSGNATFSTTTTTSITNIYGIA